MCSNTPFCFYESFQVCKLINCIQMDCKPGNSDKCPMKLALSRNFKQEENLNTSYINPYLTDTSLSIATVTKSPLRNNLSLRKVYPLD